jgi:hypothetical protein
VSARRLPLSSALERVRAVLRGAVGFALLAAPLLAQAPAHPQPSGDVIGPVAHIQPPPANYKFPDGVTYVYAAEWRLWNAGTATLHVDSAGGAQQVTAKADSSGFVSLLYRVHDRFDAFFDPRTFCSQRLHKHTEEGFRKRETEIQYDYARRKSVLDEVNLKTNERKHSEQDIPGCVTDVLSGILYVGSLPLQVGNTYVFPLNDGGKTVDVSISVEGREQIKTDAGVFATLRVQPTGSSGLLKERGRVWIWYSDDAQHIPVQMRARMFWGTLNLRLQRIDRVAPAAK